MVNFNALTQNYVPQYYALFYHEMAFFKIENKVRLDAPIQNFIQTVYTCIKGGSIHNKIIHKHLYAFFKKITENANHAPLECARGIA